MSKGKHKINKWVGRSMCIAIIFVMSAYLLHSWPIPYIRTRIGSQDVVINRFTGQVQDNDAPVLEVAPPTKSFLSSDDLYCLDFTWASDNSPKVQFDVYNKTSHDIHGYCLVHIGVRDIHGTMKGDRELEVQVNVPAHTIQHGVEVDTGIQFDTDKDAFAWNTEVSAVDSPFTLKDDYLKFDVPGVAAPFYFSRGTDKNRIHSLLAELPEVQRVLQRAEGERAHRLHKDRVVAVETQHEASTTDEGTAKQSQPTPSDDSTTRTISIGSTQEHVKAVMGPPTSIVGSGEDAWWCYGSDHVAFKGGKVESYSNDGGRLPIR